MYCDNPPQFFSYTEPAARKEHHCCECGGKILVGEKHFQWTGKWDGDVSSGRQHFLCMETCMFIRDEFEGGECIGFGEMWEWYGESKWQTDKNHQSWQKLRNMIARILIRARKETYSGGR